MSFSLRWVVAAAVIVFCLTISLYFYFQPSHQEKSYLIAKSIFADDEGATLILSDGSRVVLDSTKTGFLTTENGSLLFRDSDGALVYKSTETNTLESNQLNTVKTGYGQRFKIELPDETIVWLNTATTLIFPSSFSNQLERKVVLNGEAFFEVAKDEELPFIVHSGSQEVQVLGTQFNVEGYSDEPTAKTSLIEGSVRVINLNSQEEAFLSPGQQSVITDSVFIIRPLVSTNVLSWKNNYFDFDFANIKHVMQEISRWYNIEVVYEGDVSDLYFTGTLNRSKSLYETLRVIEHTNTIEYRMESVLKSSPERRLVIMKK